MMGWTGLQAADGNRTRIIALEGRGSTVELPPHGRTRLEERFPTMTVCTNDVALGDLVEDGLPGEVGTRLLCP